MKVVDVLPESDCSFCHKQKKVLVVELATGKHTKLCLKDFERMADMNFAKEPETPAVK